MDAPRQPSMEEVREAHRALEAMQHGLQCPICLSVFTQPLSTPCNHQFCRDCIHRHLVKRTTCPLCKAPVSKRGLRDMLTLSDVVAAVKGIVRAVEADTDGCETLGMNEPQWRSTPAVAAAYQASPDPAEENDNDGYEAEAWEAPPPYEDEAAAVSGLEDQGAQAMDSDGTRSGPDSPGPLDAGAGDADDPFLSETDAGGEAEESTLGPPPAQSWEIFESSQP